MLRALRLLLLVFVTVPVALGEATPAALGHLLRARAELGDADWSAIVGIAPRGADRPQEAALVFEFANALWLYRPADGTQSLSRHWNTVAADRGRLPELLQEIDPSWVTCRQFTAAELGRARRSTGELPNGCFVQSVGRARRLQQEAALKEAYLVSYYAKTPQGQQGHTVLCYEDEKGQHLFDPADGSTTRVSEVSFYDEALAIARKLTPFYLASRLTKAAKIALFDSGSDHGSRRAGSAAGPRPALR